MAQLQALTESAPPGRAVTVAVDAPAGRRWLTLAAVLVGTFMAILDAFIVNVALPSMQRTIRATPADLELVLAAYSLVYAVFLITGGRLGDILGRKKLFLLGMALFTAASAMCGFSPTPTLLIASRAVQGFGAAMMYPQILSIIQVTFVGDDRNLALGLFAGVNGFASVVAQLFGGFLISLNLDGLAWRPIFLVNVPIGIAGVIAGLVFLRESKAKPSPKLDLPGVGLITAALTSLILPLVEGQAAGWPLWMVLLLVLSLPLLVTFVVYERRKVSRGGFPLVNVQLFSQRAFSIGIPLSVLFFSTLSGFFFVLAIFLQDGLGFSALAAGLTFTPIGIGFICASLSAPRVVRRIGRNTLRIGYALDMVGFLALIGMLKLHGTGIDTLELVPPLLVVGLGNGFGMAPLIGTVLARARTEDVGQASGMMTTSIQIGNTIGVAIYGLVLFSLLGALGVASSAATFVSTFELIAVCFLGAAIVCFALVSGLAKAVGRERDILLERMPRTLSGLAYSFFFLSGGRLGKALFNEMLEGALKRRYDELATSDSLEDHMVRVFVEINREDPKWIRFLVREALESEGFEAMKEERERLIHSIVEDLRERQRKGQISGDVDPEYLALFMFAASFYPRIFAHVTKAVTGLDPSDPEFEKRWSDFLRDLARKYEREGPS